MKTSVKEGTKGGQNGTKSANPPKKRKNREKNVRRECVQAKATAQCRTSTLCRFMYCSYASGLEAFPLFIF
jgi:hypothetical protein